MKRYLNDSNAPPQPGTVLRARVMPKPGLCINQAAQEMKIARQTLHRVLAGHATLTPDMALRVAGLSATHPESWLNMQLRHHFWRVKQNLASVLASIPAHPVPRFARLPEKARCA